MYGDDLKDRFLKTVKNRSIRDQYQIFFNVFEERAEIPAGKSLVEMSAEEFKQRLADLDILHLSTMAKRLTWLKAFVRWAIEQGVPVDSEILNIPVKDIDTSKAMRKRLYFSPVEIRDTLWSYPVDEGYFEPVFFYFAWMGVPKKKILDIRNEDVHIVKDTISVNVDGNSYWCTSSVIADELREYQKVNKVVRENAYRYELYSDDIGYFIKNMIVANSKKAGSRIQLRAVDLKCTTVSASLEPKKSISYSDVALSGKFYSIYADEKENGEFPTVEFNTQFADLKPSALIAMKDTYIRYTKLAATL